MQNLNLKKAAEIFEDMLPASLGKPKILSTKSAPIIFVALYAPAPYVIESGQEIYGCEFRLWHPRENFERNGTLAGAVGVSEGVSAIIVCAFNEHGTTGEMIAPYAKLILTMMNHIAEGKIEQI